MIYEKLLSVQAELKAPKGQYNSFGKYKYRSCEDILEAVKPLCKEHGLVLNLSDSVVIVGDRFYIEATASVTDTETGDSHHVKAYAREPISKKGMDDSQITGTASSYARKYALNGLFCIDDTKDADTDEHFKQTTKGGDIPSPKMDRIPNGAPKASAEQVSKIKAECKRCGITQKFLMDSFPNAGGKVENLTNSQAIAVLNKLEKAPDKGA